MKVVAFNTSVRKDGNTAILIKQVFKELEAANIQTRMLFAGNLTKHPCFDDMRKSSSGYRIVGDLANTDKIMNDTFWVGVYPGMTIEMIEYMIAAIAEGKYGIK